MSNNPTTGDRQAKAQASRTPSINLLPSRNPHPIRSTPKLVELNGIEPMTS